MMHFKMYMQEFKTHGEQACFKVKFKICIQASSQISINMI